ncbi:MAG: DUF1552 domain-containing protein [Planctomycetia bacterium]|nr:DUF1552 domain-containing protein [Planctomycetia bacterium]
MAKIRPLSRRSVLQGLGATIALPWLDIMAEGLNAAQRAAADPPRLSFFYIPGSVLRPAWFPKETGFDYTLPQTMQHIARFRDQVTIISGTMHIQGQVGGHAHKLNWLTAHHIREKPGTFTNSISVDQVAAQHLGNTYLPSLVLSFATDGGDFGCTLSRNALGADIPPLANPRAVFDALFPAKDPAAIGEQKKRLAQRRSILDAASGDISSLQRDLGTGDRQRLDEYLSSVRDLERRLATREGLLAAARAEVSLGGINLDQPSYATGPTVSMREWMEAMTDLVVLGLQTDMTRIVTYALADEGTPGTYGREWVEWKAQYKHKYSNPHNMHHIGGDLEELESAEARTMAARDALFIQCFGRMLDQLAKIPARDGTLLDHCQLLIGGAQDRTHRAVNFPLLVAGGKKLGWKHGQHVRYPQGKVPTSDLFLTMLAAAGCPVKSFKESRGILSELLT